MQNVYLLPEELRHCLAELGHVLQSRQFLCATAESCTGGLLGAAITNIPGASAWYAGGVTAYANHVKNAVLGVSNDILITQGAVSEACVCAMAEGACRVLGAQVAVSVSGVAGPSGGTQHKPVGTVWLGFCVEEQISAQKLHLKGDRESIRAQATLFAMQGMLARLIP